VAQAVGNLAKCGAGDGGGTIDVIHESGDIVEDNGKVRIELAFHGYGASAEGWRFDVYLIH